MRYNLLSVGADAKTVKGEKFGYLTGILYLQPADMSGTNLCPMASAGCKAACLFTAGMGRFPSVKAGRARKTQLFLNNRQSFMKQIVMDIGILELEAKFKGMKPVVRLNGTSDIQWENILHDGKTIFEHFPNVQFMDYTKIVKRMMPLAKAQKIENYHLTFSRSESNHALADTVISMGGNVAVVFAGNPPSVFMGRPVVDGDKSDLRFIDGDNVIVALKAKGRAKYDTTGFIVR